MNIPVSDTWQQANANYLLLAVESIRLRLEEHIHPEQAATTEMLLEIESTLASIFDQMHPPPALEHLCITLGLSSFERHILFLCVAPALLPNWSTLRAQAPSDPPMTQPTFGLAQHLFPDVHWSAFTPQAPLRRWHLIHLGNDDLPTRSPLQLDEAILHYLLGEPYDDPHLKGLLRPLTIGQIALPPSYEQLVEQLVKTWSTFDSTQPPSLLQLCHPDANLRATIATHICQQLGLSLFALDAAALPTNLDDLNHLRHRWERQAQLVPSALVLISDHLNLSEPGRAMAVAQWCDHLQTPLLLSSDHRQQLSTRASLSFEISALTASEQRHLWQTHLDDASIELNGHLDQLVCQFNLSPTAIQTTCQQFKAQSHAPQHSTPHIPHPLWTLCRHQARPQLDELSQRIKSTATWDDLVLPEQQCQLLQELAIHLRQRVQVYQHWGFGKQGDRGLGISALFHGESGTGKTMAAEVLAHEFHLDLYRIDLSAVVSKYIGETEKNLRQIFDAAEAGGAILLFDEADALFGKRTEVKDSHDRHANIEVSYLLQRMETYRGVSILTSNYKSALDKAFLRRLRFVVAFPFPKAKARADIWQRIFPLQTPTKDLDFQKLGQLQVAGGNIRNIALNAAFLAADAHSPVGMEHLFEATQREYLKLERLLTDEETMGWLDTP